MVHGINPKVYSAMFTTPIVVTTKGPTDSWGDSLPDTIIEFKCYVHQESQIVLNAVGKEELSGTQLYLAGKDIKAIKMTDLVTVEDAIEQRIISKSSFHGRGSVPVIGVIYLP